MTRERQIRALLREAGRAREEGDYLSALRALDEAQKLTEKDRRDRLEGVIQGLKEKTQ